MTPVKLLRCIVYFFVWSGIAIVFASAALLLYGLYPKSIRVEHVEVESARVGRNLERLKIVFLADFHFKRSDRINGELLSRLRVLEPDIVLLGGDYIEHIQVLPDFADFAAKIPARIGTFAIMGNWEIQSGAGAGNVTTALRKRGVTVLENQVESVNVDGQTLNIAGLGEAIWGYDDLHLLKSRLNPGGFTILLAHVPFVFDRLEELPVDLMLAGHSHGGQVCLPGVGPLWMPFGSGGYASGMFEKNGRRLYVTRGVGTSLLPVRIGCPPEITVIHLKHKAPACPDECACRDKS